MPPMPSMPMMPPPPPQGMMSGMPPMPPAGGMQSPAGMISPQVQALATQQDQQLASIQQQMRDQVVKLLTMLPTYNPAGAAAVSEPLPQATSPTGQDQQMPTQDQSQGGGMY